jgi:hypothetical protein
MPLPDTLPGLVYLAWYDQQRHRVFRGGWRGYLVAAAAVAELYLDGYLVDEAGKARPVDGRQSPVDPVLAELWRRIGETRPRRWPHWVSQRGLDRVIRDELATRWIRVERPPGILRRTRITMRDPLALGQLRDLVGSTLRGSTPVDRLPDRDAMLVALLAVGEVLPRRRGDRDRRITDLIARGGPPVDGLRRAIRQAKLAYSGSG